MKKNFLLVDDDSVFNFLNSKLVNQTGIANEIKTALNGLEALTMMENCQQGICNLPDFILLDINMPLMNGFEFLEAFQKMEIDHKEKIHIAIVTSSSDEEDIKKAKSLGIKYFFSKPLLEEDILRLLDKELSQN